MRKADSYRVVIEGNVKVSYKGVPEYKNAFRVLDRRNEDRTLNSAEVLHQVAGRRNGVGHVVNINNNGA